MGSTFSIENNTSKVVWVKADVNAGVMWGIILGVAAVGVVVTGGLLGAVIGGAVATIGVAVVPAASAVEFVLGTSVGALADKLKISLDEAGKIKSSTEKFVQSAVRLNPGDKKQVYSGTLSMMMLVTALNEDFKMEKANCWTGPTDKSNNNYKVSEKFPGLM